MAEIIHANICIIGGGLGGVSVAAGAMQMGARTVLFERGKIGGDCRYTALPSLSLVLWSLTYQLYLHMTELKSFLAYWCYNFSDVLIVKKIKYFPALNCFE